MSASEIPNLISILVKIKSKKTEVNRIDQNNFVILVTAPPVNGKANEMIVELLADYFNLPKSKLEIISGLKSKKKTIKIFK